MYCKFVVKFYFDKNFGDEEVEVKFKDLLEVYECLSDF